MNIDLSIIVCVYDDKRVMRCIRSIISQDFGNLLWEVLVIENGSNKFDRLSKEKNTRYLQQREKNMAKARSLGVKNSHGKYCLFTDADCVVDRHWSKNMYDMLSKDDNACAGGRIMRYDPKTKTEVFGRNLAWGQTTLQHYLPMINYPYVVFANAGFSRAILLDVGPFDEVLLSGNDVDICWRLHKKGYKFLINDAAKVWHENRKSVKDYFTTFFRYSVYQVLLFHKYLSDIREFKKKKKKNYHRKYLSSETFSYIAYWNRY
ncbi:MAG: glycosyltransferase [Nanoarchaeota archaeon]|nr:glycosyltransferase [Nanoarchaeota archaeon]